MVWRWWWIATAHVHWNNLWGWSNGMLHVHHQFSEKESPGIANTHAHIIYIYIYLFHIVYQKRATAHFPATSLVTNIMKLTHAEWKQKRVEMTWRQDESIQFKNPTQTIEIKQPHQTTYLSTLSNWNGLFKKIFQIGPKIHQSNGNGDQHPKALSK